MMTGLYLLARLADRAIAIDAVRVEAVVSLEAVVPVPRAAPGVRGVAALRSRVVTVIDSRAVLGLGEDATGDGSAIIIRIDDHDYAFLVDAVADVAAHDATPLPDGLVLEGCWRRAARAMIRADGDPALVIAPEALLPAPSNTA